MSWFKKIGKIYKKNQEFLLKVIKKANYAIA